MRSLLLALICGSLFTMACGKKKAGIPGQMQRVKLGYTERGLASWYGHPYHGRATASGEVYDMEKLTAAHKRLPFGVTARVLNPANGRSVDVRINDRGPFVKGRIIDLSRAAARQIELLGPGVAKVRIQVIAAPANVRAQGMPSSREARGWAFRLRPWRRIPAQREDETPFIFAGAMLEESGLATVPDSVPSLLTPIPAQ